MYVLFLGKGILYKDTFWAITPNFDDNLIQNKLVERHANHQKTVLKYYAPSYDGFLHFYNVGGIFLAGKICIRHYGPDS